MSKGIVEATESTCTGTGKYVADVVGESVVVLQALLIPDSANGGALCAPISSADFTVGT